MSTFINHQLVCRRPKFDFAATPIHWIANDAFTTHVFNSLNVFIPEIEHWFCRLSNQTLPYVQDENLRADIKGFVAQEAAHANAHKAARAYFDAHNIDASAFTATVEWLLRNIMNDTPLGMTWPFKALKREWLAYRMGIIACWEHYFCFIGTWILEAKSLDDVSDPAMLDLMRWHGAEEVEHRTVAFDAYRALAGEGLGSYIGRQAAMVVAFPIMFIFWLEATAHLGKVDGTVEGQKIGRQSLPKLIIKFGQTARRTGRLPTIGSLLNSLGLWLKPSHHPEHDGDIEAALRYIADSPAAQLALAK
jgi:predicted metal-dependent hydrolase